MHGPCTSCSWFRTAKPLSELLGGALASADAPVLTALGKIQEDEKELHAQELMLRAQLDQKGQMKWAARPLISSYCGIEEANGVFYVAEIRNRQSITCETHSTAPRVEHSCTTCAHRVVPTGQMKDLEQGQAYAAMSWGKTATGNSSSMIENLWKEHLAGTANRRANEVRDAYQRKGVLASEPEYLDYCRRLSGERHFVLCAVQNPDDTCPLWSATAAERTDAAVPVRAAPPVTTPTAAAPSVAGPAVSGFDIDALFSLADDDGAHDDVPPALRALVDGFVDFAGCMLGITLSSQQVAALRAELVRSCADRESEIARAVDAAVASFQGVKGADIKARHAWRQQNQGTWLQQLARTTDPLCRMLAGWHAAATQVLAPGTPPLTREAAESWTELMTFAASASAGSDPSLEPPDLEQQIARLAQGYSLLSQRERSLIALAPVTLYETRRAWSGLSADEKRATRARIAAQLGSAGRAGPEAAPPPPPRTEVPPPPPPARTDSAPALRHAAVNPWLTASPRRERPASVQQAPTDESTLDRLTREFAEAQARGDHRKAADLQLQIQMELQKETARREMDSNIAKMFHDMRMKTIDNMK